MAKIPFTLEAWLKDKNQKVKTRDGRIVHNIWPVKEPLIVNGKRAEVCALIDGEEDALVFFEGGKYLPVNSENPFDLFIVTPEPEPLTKLEKAIFDMLVERTNEATISEKQARKYAPMFLEIAKDEIYSYESLVEYAEKAKAAGKAEALKDLPRWRKDFEFMGVRDPEIVGPWLCYKKNRIVITDLEKLPGFKED